MSARSPWLPPSVFNAGGGYSEAKAKHSASEKIFDLCTSDGVISSKTRVSRREMHAVISIEDIDTNFVGLHAPQIQLSFVLKSSITQLGVNAENASVTLDAENLSAKVEVDLIAH
eukprot:CAMPEP_0176445740 /NCGR_PEP_ID=MMETSP0127-20121128/23896_1 /TAXON_ID=938130 /ORGANISM="Platyophrya macrostoma, Strain WH" /LENGTH=114 /DNA_ID=CAMNT_0017831613 /DNA_START=58 /DNA_END=399 /DNA_ORIENTATION=+